MPSNLNTCCQPLTKDGQPRPCPCSRCNTCELATLDCKLGNQYCVYDYQAKKFTPVPFDAAKANTADYCFLHGPFEKSCLTCIHNLKLDYYNMFEFRPFTEEIEDLPF